MFRALLVTLTIISLILPVISYRYFIQLMKLVKIRRANFLLAGTMTVLTGYIFFLLPWIFIGDDVPEIRIFSYYIILIGLIILVYGVIKIYMDWKEVIK